METTQKKAKRIGLLGLGVLLSCLMLSTACSPATDLGPIENGAYSLPVGGFWYAVHPDWFAKPHHDYPAADIPVPTGTTIGAVASGVVVSGNTGGSCGNGVVIDGNDGYRYTYCHGSYTTVSNGQRVLAGDQIMVSGYSGGVVPAGPGGSHLHLQIKAWYGNGDWVCPQAALAAWAKGHMVDMNSLPRSGCSY